jgi:hypothetical protein
MDTMLMKELIDHIDAIAWDENVPETNRLQQIQGMLYQWGQIQDKKTEDMFGSDQYPLHDEESPYPNMRRC